MNKLERLGSKVEVRCVKKLYENHVKRLKENDQVAEAKSRELITPLLLLLTTLGCKSSGTPIVVHVVLRGCHHFCRQVYFSSNRNGKRFSTND